jgi:hypothetical protein
VEDFDPIATLLLFAFSAVIGIAGIYAILDAVL